MAVYEYRCLQCRKKFEIVEAIAEHERKRAKKCPKCGTAKVERIYSSLFVETARKS